MLWTADGDNDVDDNGKKTNLASKYTNMLSLSLCVCVSNFEMDDNNSSDGSLHRLRVSSCPVSSSPFVVAPPPPRIRRQRSVLRGSESLLLIPTCAHVSVCACLCSVERVIWLCCVCVCANVWKALTHIYILHSIAPTLLVSVCVFAHYLRRRRRRKFTDCKFVRRKKMFSYHVRAPPATAVTTVQSNGRKMSQLLADLFSTL